MKKLIAFLLASLMVACCFAVSASASTNLIAGNQNYTLESSDGKIAYRAYSSCDHLCPPTEGVDLGLYSGQLTDGNIRIGTEDSLIPTDAAVGITVELDGTDRVHTYTFPLGAQKSVESVVVKVAKIYGNRGANIVGVEVSDDGQTWTAVDFAVSIAPVPYTGQGNANYGVEGAVEDIRDMFFDITASFSTVNASYVKVSLDTSNPDESVCYIKNGSEETGYRYDRGFVLSFDEIEIYGGEPVSEQPPVEDPSESDPVDEPSEDVSVDDPSVDDPSEDVSVDDPSEDVSVDDPSEDVSVDDPSEDVSVDDPSEDVSVDEPSEDVSVDEPSEDVSVEDPSEDTSVEEPDNNTTPSTGDAGLAIFAVLAVVSMAGVVVAKKVK